MNSRTYKIWSVKSIRKYVSPYYSIATRCTKYQKPMTQAMTGGLELDHLAGTASWIAFFIVTTSQERIQDLIPNYPCLSAYCLHRDCTAYRSTQRYFLQILCRSLMSTRAQIDHLIFTSSLTCPWGQAWSQNYQPCTSIPPRMLQKEGILYLWSYF